MRPFPRDDERDGVCLSQTQGYESAGTSKAPICNQEGAPFDETGSSAQGVGRLLRNGGRKSPCGTMARDCVALHRPRPNSPRCARPDFEHCGPCSDGGLHTGVLGAGGFVHWRPCLDGGLYTGRGRHCTNPLQNAPPSAQSPGRHFQALYKPPAERALRCAKSRRILQASHPTAGSERLAHPPRTHSLCRSLT